MKKFLYLLISATILLSSCAKDTVYLEPGGNTNGGGGTGSAGSLEGTKWKVTSMILGQEINGIKAEEDIFAIGEPCSKDNIAHFNRGGVFIFDEGASKCDATDPQQETGTWSLSADKKKLTLTSAMFNDDSAPVIYEISQTSSKLTLTSRESITIDVGGQVVKTDMYLIVGFAPHK